jgi:hypothetical protein
VYRHVVHFVATVAVLLMVLPPVFDAFDTWDKRPEFPMVGRNTETNIVVWTADLAMCLVVAFESICLMQWLVRLFAPYLLQIFSVPLGPEVRATEYLLLLFSPPWRVVSLRI